MTDVAKLAAKPAGADQITRAREIAGSSLVLQAKLDEFLAGKPSRGEMIDFMESLKAGVNENDPTEDGILEKKIMGICRSLGIENPTNTEKLLALQAGLLQEQNLVLSRGLDRPIVASPTSMGASSRGTLTSLVLGAVVGAAVTS